MRVVAVETLRPAFQQNLCVVALHSDEGLVGLGDTFFQAHAVEAYLHEHVAPLLLGLEGPSPEATAALLSPYVGYQGGGVEMRANGSVDIALWDLRAKSLGVRVVDLLGGPVRDSIDVYNTCAGPGYIQEVSRQSSDNWGVGRGSQLEDLDAFLTRPGALARDLLDEGLRGMKVWPFDRAAEASRGTRIRPGELSAGLKIVESIREAVGMEMDLMIELHALWTRAAAVEICSALAEFRPFWVEDPLRADAIDSLVALRDQTGVPIAIGETATGRRGFLPLLQQGVASYATVDVQWTGGITEARKVAMLADAFSVPVAPHDCTGPVTLAACFQLVFAQPNALVQETVRSFLRTWYPRVVTGLPDIEGGRATLGGAPGLGVALVEGLREDPAVVRRVSTLETA